MKNIFQTAISNEVIDRINKLTPTTKQLWGKMNVAQMLAHCCVSYEMVYDDIHKKPNAFMRFLLKTFAKEKVVGDKPFKKNGPTAPVFKIDTDKDFTKEKIRLINYIQRTEELGESYFDGKESLSFGILTKTEWNNMFYKHLDHHLKQFGV